MTDRASAFGDTVELGNHLPWWLAMVLAVTSYFSSSHIRRFLFFPRVPLQIGGNEILARFVALPLPSYGAYIALIIFFVNKKIVEK